MAHQFFAEIILPLALPGTFTYHLLPEEKSRLEIGQRVAVPFGSKKLYTGIVHSFHQNQPELYKTKGIDSILEDYPMVTPVQIKFWEWMAEYYMCTLGEVYRNAFPSALKWESETFIYLNDVEGNQEDLSEEEQILLDLLESKGSVSLNEATEIVNQKLIIKIVKSLWEKNRIRLDEVLKEKYTPKIERFVKVNPELKSDERKFNETMDVLKNANRQREILLQLIVEETQNPKPIKISKFLKTIGASHSILNSMAAKGILCIYELNTTRIGEIEDTQDEVRSLTLEQQKALKIIQSDFQGKKPV